VSRTFATKKKKTEKKGRRVGPLPTAPCRSAPSSLATNPRLRIFDRRLMMLETMEETMLGRHDILLTSDAANTRHRVHDARLVAARQRQIVVVGHFAIECPVLLLEDESRPAMCPLGEPSFSNGEHPLPRSSPRCRPRSARVG